MKLQLALAGLLAASFALPSVARADEWYVVQDVQTKHCTVVDKRPVTTTMTVVGPDGVIYKTRAEAENAMKTVKVCTND